MCSTVEISNLCSIVEHSKRLCELPALFSWPRLKLNLERGGYGVSDTCVDAPAFRDGDARPSHVLRLSSVS